MCWGLFICRKFFPGSRVPVPRAIFYNAFSEKGFLITEPDIGPLGFSRISRHFLLSEGENYQCLYRKKNLIHPFNSFKATDPPPSVTLSPNVNHFTISCGNGSLLFVKICLNSSCAQDSSVWKVTLKCWTTFLHVYSPGFLVMTRQSTLATKLSFSMILKNPWIRMPWG